MNFKVGDVLICIKPPEGGPIYAGKVYTVREISYEGFLYFKELSHVENGWLAHRFEYAKQPSFDKLYLTLKNG